MMNNSAVPPAELLPWLTHEQFLTKKLLAQAGDARLRVLNQSWKSTPWWDKYALLLDCECVMHREILTLAWDKPCWYARTILPRTTYKADQALFDRLQTETLGTLIFEGTQIERVSLRHYAINQQAIEYHWLTPAMKQGAECFWVRSSVFKLKSVTCSDHCFYLIEILLPGLESYLCSG